MKIDIKETEYRCFECGRTLLLVNGKVYCENCGVSRSLKDYLELKDLFTKAGIINEDGDIDPEDYTNIYPNDPEDDKPEYCDICGGPYHNCTTSCKLFDD